VANQLSTKFDDKIWVVKLSSYMMQNFSVYALAGC